MSLTAFTHPISNVSRCPMPQLFARRPRKWNQSEQLMPHFSPVPVSKKVIEIKQPFRRRITETSNRLLKLTSAASLLCVIDCTILPFVTLALPFLGLGATSKQARILHDVGHNLALWFVLPVGTFAATMNFLSHRRPKISFIAVIGLSLIFLSNCNGTILSLLPLTIKKNLHCGFWHSLINISGCGLLLGSNTVLHRLSCESRNQNNSRFSFRRLKGGCSCCFDGAMKTDNRVVMKLHTEAAENFFTWEKPPLN